MNSENIKTKQCNTCHEVKDIEEFPVDSGRAYRRNRCRDCENKLERVRRKLHKEVGEPPKDHCCSICNTPEEKAMELTSSRCKTPWVLDHCHDTDTFRGWICHSCNRVLGQVKDSREHLLKMYKYLDKHKTKEQDEQVK